MCKKRWFIKPPTQLLHVSKISRTKTGGVHKNTAFHSFKNYAVDGYKNALRKINIPNYECFEDVNRAYLDIFQKIITVIDNIAPCKSKRVKGNIQN